MDGDRFDEEELEESMLSESDFEDDYMSDIDEPDIGNNFDDDDF